MKCSEESRYPFIGGQSHMFNENEVKMAAQSSVTRKL